MRLNIGARISLCGMIAEYNTYNEGGEHAGGLTQHRPADHAAGHASRASSSSTTATASKRRSSYLAGLLGDGKLHYDETIVEGGLEAAPDALAQLFSGANLGKLLVRLAE